MICFAIDTGSTRNASALVGVHDASRIWTIIYARRWQGVADRPLDHRNVVGPEMAGVVRAHGCDTWMGDAFEQGPMRLVSLDHGLVFKLQGGELDVVYGHARAANQDGRIRVASDADTACVAEIREGLKRIQAQHVGGKTKVWLPEDGAGHFDVCSAFLRAMFFGRAGDEATQTQPSAFGSTAYAEQSRGAAWYPTPGY